MEKIFENTTVYTHEIYSLFLEFHNRKYNLKYNLYTCFISFLIIFCMVLQFLNGNIDMSIIFVLIFIAFIFWRVFHPYFIVEKEVKSDKIQKQLKNTYYFFDKYFEISNTGGLSRIKYYKLYKIFQDEHSFYLYINKDHAFIVSKNGFTLGEVNAFYSFIKKRKLHRFF